MTTSVNRNTATLDIGAVLHQWNELYVSWLANSWWHHGPRPAMMQVNQGLSSTKSSAMVALPTQPGSKVQFGILRWPLISQIRIAAGIGCSSAASSTKATAVLSLTISTIVATILRASPHGLNSFLRHQSPFLPQRCLVPSIIRQPPKQTILGNNSPSSRKGG